MGTLKYEFCTLILITTIYVLNLFIVIFLLLLLLSYGSHITIPRRLQSSTVLVL